MFEKGVWGMERLKRGSSDYRDALFCMFLGSMVIFAVLYWPQPLIAKLSEVYRQEPSTMSLTISLSTISIAMTLIIAPLLSNRWGRKRTMAVSLLLTSFLTMVAPLTSSLALLLVARLLTGISISGFLASSMAYLQEEFERENLGRVFGLYVAGTVAGGVIGRIASGVLSDILSWQTAVFILGGCCFLFSLLFWRFLPSSNHFQRKTISWSAWCKGMKASFSNYRLLKLYMTSFLLMGVYVSLFNYLSYPLTARPYSFNQSIIGLLFLFTLSGVYGSLWFGKLADRIPRPLILCIAIFLMLGGGILTMPSLIVWKFIGITLFSFGFFAAHAVASGWVALIAPIQHKSEATSIYSLFYYAGSSVIGWASGYIFTLYGWAWFIIGLSILLIGLIIMHVASISRSMTEKKEERFSS